MVVLQTQHVAEHHSLSLDFLLQYSTAYQTRHGIPDKCFNIITAFIAPTCHSRNEESEDPDSTQSSPHDTVVTGPVCPLRTPTLDTSDKSYTLT